MDSVFDKPLMISEFEPVTQLKRKEHLVKTPRFPVIDTHSHFGVLGMGENYADRYNLDKAVDRFRECGVRHMINLDGDYGGKLEKMLNFTQKYRDFFSTFGSVDLERVYQAGFPKYVKETIARSVELGISGLKFWKILGLGIKDAQGKYLLADDERLDVIWETAREYHLPTVLHLGDPVAFFKTIDFRNPISVLNILSTLDLPLIFQNMFSSISPCLLLLPLSYACLML